VIKIAYFSAGILFTGFGIVGIVVPGLPTTIFMIVAAACFFHSSTKMYNWVIHHPLFGQSVLRFREGKGMPKKAKYFSISMMWFFISTSVFIFLYAAASWVKIIIVICGMIGTSYIIKQPTLTR
jgi:uncharacterized membrane protein YbaN (DUF454 family)|tara:strand:+ start:4112 stop:4483 length:372 start_codon:yes stop_codon:yes gene_type:complete